jgi:uroporphyrinogen-III synthase
MPPVPVAAVGPATAAAVTAAGGVVEVVGEGDGDALGDLVAPTLAGRRVVFPHSRSVDPARIDRLRRVGAEMIAAVVYDTIPVPPGPDPVDAAIFASPSAVFGWLQSRTFSELSVVAALGSTTRAQLEGAGVADPVMGSRPTVPSLVDALVARLERR